MADVHDFDSVIFQRKITELWGIATKSQGATALLFLGKNNNGGTTTPHYCDV